MVAATDAFLTMINTTAPGGSGSKRAVRDAHALMRDEPGEAVLEAAFALLDQRWKSPTTGGGRRPAGGDLAR